MFTSGYASLALSSRSSKPSYIDVVENFERRSDDHAYVIRSFISQCIEHNTSEDFFQILYLLQENISGLNGQFQDLCFVHRDYAAEMGFSCPLEQSRRPGRPKFQIPVEVIRGLHDIHSVWREVAKEADVSYKTVLRRRYQYSMVVNETTGPRITYSDIPNGQLCQVVNEVRHWSTVKQRNSRPKMAYT